MNWCHAFKLRTVFVLFLTKIWRNVVKIDSTDTCFFCIYWHMLFCIYTFVSLEDIPLVWLVALTVPNDSYKFEYTCDFPCSPSYPHLPPQALLFLAWSLHIEFLKCVNNFVLGRFLQWPLVRCGLTFSKVIIKVTHNLSKLIMHSFVLFDALNNRSTVQAEQK